ncbi:hypothetical protein GCM10022218_41490 [Sphingobacterium ginsenosidimutans]|uniref:Uncharacterized protein n=1 Tax=Sphingobacterium ginsenosidimutans TaxID=687845 RepID=A0ABP8AFL7_9SPHI
MVKCVRYDKTTYYSHIKKADLDFAILLVYGKEIAYDFTKESPEIEACLLERNNKNRPR